MPSTVDFIGDAGGSFDSVEREAADWFVRRDHGLTPAEEAEFSRWLAANHRHAEIFGELMETWSSLRLVSPSGPEVSARPKGKKLAWLPLPLAAAAAFAALCMLWEFGHRANRNFSQSVVTEVGALRDLKLPDGSTILLSADSVLTVQFTAKDRGITLRRGEASFHVAKNSAWPFVVRAGAIDVIAVGTAFDIRLRSNAVDLLVTEGKVGVHSSVDGESLVAVASADSKPLLVAGQSLHFSLSPVAACSPTTAQSLTQKQIDERLAWQGRRLYFNDDRLADIVTEFNRFNRHKLVMGNSELANRRFGGTFPADGYEVFVKSLEDHYQVKAEQRPDETVLMLSAAANRTGAQLIGPIPSADLRNAETSRLVFRSERLADIVAQFNRYNRHKLIISDPALGERRFGGAFPATDSESFVKVLEESFHVTADRRENETFLRISP